MKNKLINIIMLNCTNAVDLIEKENFVNIGFSKRIKLNLHTALCKYCKFYQNQSKFIHNALVTKLIYINGYQTSDEFNKNKENIKKNLNELIDKL